MNTYGSELSATRRCFEQLLVLLIFFSSLVITMHLFVILTIFFVTLFVIKIRVRHHDAIEKGDLSYATVSR
jgi:hypothetical protein